MGLLITYPKAKFWYACAKKDVQETLAKHLAAWGREGVTADYVTKWEGDVPVESESVTIR